MSAASEATALPARTGSGTWARAWAPRLVGYALLGLLVGAGPALAGGAWPLHASLAAIFAIVGLSLHIVVGYTGQISLGHQAFVGTGSLVAANLVSSGPSDPSDPLHFFGSLAGAAVAGALAALVLGAVALRITGLYLSLVTLVFGSVAANAIFSISSLNGNETGVAARRPASLSTDYRFYLFCLLVVAAVCYVDIQLSRTKTGRALAAIKENELVAQAYGVNVTAFKLVSFALSGAIAGVAGGLYTFRVESFSDKNFSGTAGFNLALLFVVMVVVGGLGSRVGVVCASVFFAIVNPVLDLVVPSVPGVGDFYVQHKEYVAGLIGAALLLQTVITNPRGLGQIADPVSRWMRGGRFDLHAHGPGEVGAADVRA